MEKFEDWMSFHEWMDLAQTVLLLVIAGVLIYFVYLLRIELRRAASILSQVTTGQAELNANVRRAWERIDAVEARMSVIEGRLRDQRGPSP